MIYFHVMTLSWGDEKYCPIFAPTKINPNAFNGMPNYEIIPVISLTGVKVVIMASFTIFTNPKKKANIEHKNTGVEKLIKIYLKLIFVIDKFYNF